jgi:hypothetical protein
MNGTDTAGTRNEGDRWLRQSARMLAFRRPDWKGLTPRPLLLVLFLLLPYGAWFVMQRIDAGHPAFFNWRGFLSGWASIAVQMWACWIVARSHRDPGANASETSAPDAVRLIMLAAAGGVVIHLVIVALFAVGRLLSGPGVPFSPALFLLIYLVPMLWFGVAMLRLLWSVSGSASGRAAALLTPIVVLVGLDLQPVRLWWHQGPSRAEVRAAQEKIERKRLELITLKVTDEVLDIQPYLIADALDALKPPTPGRVNVYTVTYVPDVIAQAARMDGLLAADAMRARFEGRDRTVELVLSLKTAATVPWATQDNLRRTIARIAQVMDRDRDVLFLHLGGDSAADGELQVEARPFRLAPLTPQLLKHWLDEAGIRWRVISMSACRSGGWIGPLAGDGTLVMTSTDVDRDSADCPLPMAETRYAEVLYQEGLGRTPSFELAHAHARARIDALERSAPEAGYRSAPQISVGPAIRDVLTRLERQQRDADASSAPSRPDPARRAAPRPAPAPR